MITSINEILTEWAFRTKDGLPNPKSMAHQILLEGILKNYGWSMEARAELLNNLMVEMDFKNKAAFDVYNKKHKMRKTTKVTIGGEETTAGDAKDLANPDTEKDAHDMQKPDSRGTEWDASYYGADNEREWIKDYREFEDYEDEEALAQIKWFGEKQGWGKKGELEKETTEEKKKRKAEDKAKNSTLTRLDKEYKKHGNAEYPKVERTLQKLWDGKPLDEDDKEFLKRWVRIVEPTEASPNNFRIYLAPSEGHFSRTKKDSNGRIAQKIVDAENATVGDFRDMMQKAGIATKRTSTMGGKKSTPAQTFTRKNGNTALLSDPKPAGKGIKSEVTRDSGGAVTSIKLSDDLTIHRIPKPAGKEADNVRKQRIQNNRNLDEYAQLIDEGDLEFIDLDSGVMPDSPQNRVRVIKESLSTLAQRLEDMGQLPVKNQVPGIPNPPKIPTLSTKIINDLKAFAKKDPNKNSQKWFLELQAHMSKISNDELLQEAWANYAEVYDAIREMHDDGNGTQNGACALLPESTTLETVDVLTASGGNATSKIVTLNGRSVKKGPGGPSQLTAKIKKSQMKAVKGKNGVVIPADPDPNNPGASVQEKAIALSRANIHIYPETKKNGSKGLSMSLDISNKEKDKHLKYLNDYDAKLEKMGKELGVSDKYIAYIKEKMHAPARPGKPSPIESAVNGIMGKRSDPTKYDSSDNARAIIEKRMESYYLYQAISHRAYNQNLDFQYFANDSILSQQGERGFGKDTYDTAMAGKGRIEVDKSDGVNTIAWPKFEFNIGFSPDGRSTNPGSGRFHNEEEFPAWGTE